MEVDQHSQLNCSTLICYLEPQLPLPQSKSLPSFTADLGFWCTSAMLFEKSSCRCTVQHFPSNDSSMSEGSAIVCCVNDSETCTICVFFGCCFSLVKEHLKKTILRFQPKRSFNTSCSLPAFSSFEEVAASLWQTILWISLQTVQRNAFCSLPSCCYRPWFGPLKKRTGTSFIFCLECSFDNLVQPILVHVINHTVSFVYDL